MPSPSLIYNTTTGKAARNSGDTIPEGYSSERPVKAEEKEVKPSKKELTPSSQLTTQSSKESN